MAAGWETGTETAFGLDIWATGCDTVGLCTEGIGTPGAGIGLLEGAGTLRTDSISGIGVN